MRDRDVPSDRDEREVPDANRNAIDDELEPPTPDIEASRRQLLDRFKMNPGADPVLSGGDLDARWEDAEGSGEETVAGSSQTPERNDLDARGRALGITYASDEELRPGEKERARDEHRWELDPASAEDYPARKREEE
jgi:hypothetical protein